MAGGIAANAILAGLTPGGLDVQLDLGEGVNPAQGVFIEMFLTAMLTFTVLMLAAEKSKDTYLAPIGIGLALFVAEIAGVYYTGASLNPARSFGPEVAAASFEHYHYIYWFGPVMGALLAAGYYKFLKIMHYEDVNEGT